MLQKVKRKSIGLVFLVLGACGLITRCSIPAPLDQQAFDALYDTPPPATEQPLRVFHIGHSLVARDMPAMLRQLAEAEFGDGHSYESQLGWGAKMKAHWDPEVELKGAAVENDHPRYRDAHEAVNSGEYDALVLTEGIEIRDAIKYADSPVYLHKWARAAWDANPDIRIYFYETWHHLNDPEGFLERIDRDLEKYWETEILRRTLAYDDITQPIYMIPAGQVFARFVRAVEAQGGVGPVKDRTDIFATRPNGQQDQIHYNDLGAYLVALTHYAVLYQRSPVGLPHALTKADGTPAMDPGPEVARLMQETVWQVVTEYTRTGVTP